MANMQKCPVCKTINEPNALKCDCGYNFINKIGGSKRLNKTAKRSSAKKIDWFKGADKKTTTEGIRALIILSVVIYGVYWIFYSNDDSYNTEKSIKPNEEIQNIHKPKPINAFSAAEEYEVVSKKDISYTKDNKKIVRTDIRVSVNGPKSENELRKISENIILKLVKKSPQNAVSILYYLPGSSTSSYYTAGMVEWAPYGDWGKAGWTKTGNYSKHEYTIKVGGAMGKVVEPTNTNLSVSKRQEIFYSLVKLQDSGFDSGKSYSVIASRYNIEESLVKKITSEGMTKGWPMPKP